MTDRDDREHPNYGDDLPRVCPKCSRDEHCFTSDDEGVTCACGHLIEAT